MFVLALSRNSWQIEALGINPLVGPSAAALRGMGAKDTAAIVGSGARSGALPAAYSCAQARAGDRPHLALLLSREKLLVCRACMFRLRVGPSPVTSGLGCGAQA